MRENLTEKLSLIGFENSYSELVSDIQKIEETLVISMQSNIGGKTDPALLQKIQMRKSIN